MMDYEDELSLRTFEHVEDMPQTRGVVVCLSSHRRWRARTHWDRTDTLADEASSFIGEESWKPLPPTVEAHTEKPKVCEPSLWFAGLVALISFAAIIAFYWAFLAAVKAVIALSVAHF
ncbi:MAG: hypothetical protein QE284_11495 [Rhizobium sp.]|nr:hypothetical protein [Rhizobium sp.]